MEILGRADTRELEKFAYQMRLVEVSEIQCKLRPIGRRIFVNQAAGALKSLDPAKQLRRQPDLRLKSLDESPLAKTDILCSFPHSRTHVIIPENFESG